MRIRGFYKIFCISSALFILSACDRTGVIFKELNVNDGTGVTVGARQRAILVKANAGRKGYHGMKGHAGQGGRDIVCAEPSPDAMAAIASSLSLQGSVQGGGAAPGKAQGGLASSIAESAASIGLRSQTIQLLRDQLYRACEAYMNGAIAEFQYNAIINNMDRVIISALAVDALGGSPVAPAVAIGTKASSEAPADPEKKADGGAVVKANAESIESKFHQVTVNTPPEQAHRSEAITRIALKVLDRNPTAGVCLGMLADAKIVKQAAPEAIKFCKQQLHLAIHAGEARMKTKPVKSHGHRH